LKFETTDVQKTHHRNNNIDQKIKLPLEQTSYSEKAIWIVHSVLVMWWTSIR